MPKRCEERRGTLCAAPTVPWSFTVGFVVCQFAMRVADGLATAPEVAFMSRLMELIDRDGAWGMEVYR